MKPAQLAALFLVLAALLVVGVVKKSSIERRAEQERAEQARALEPVVPGLAAEFVERIEIRRGFGESEKITIRKVDSAWKIETHHGARALAHTVKSLLDELASAVGEARSESQALLVDYALGDHQGIHVILFGPGGESKAHVVVSPLRPGGTRNFVRRDGSAKVLQTDSDFLSAIGIFSKDDSLDPVYFLDLRVAPFDVAKVERVELFSNRGGLALKRLGEPVGWEFDPPDSNQSVDASRVSDLLSRLANLHGKEVVDSGSVKGFRDKPWVKLALSGQPTLELFLSGPVADKKLAYLKSMPDDVVYAMDESVLTGLLQKERSSFLRPKT